MASRPARQRLRAGAAGENTDLASYEFLLMEAMTDSPADDYVYDEASGERIPAAEATRRAAVANQVEVRDSAGNLLANGDSVITIKDLKVKGAGQTLRRGTVIKSIRLTDNPEEIDCRYEAIKGLVLRTEFVRKH
jgi:protein PhnA